MKRLTKVDDQGRLLVYSVSDTGLPILITKSNSYRKLIERLKTYEDTGLEPEEVESLNIFDGSQAVMATAKLQEEQRKHRWIPVSEQLPEKPEEPPEFDNKTLELYLVTVKNSERPFRAFWNGASFTDGLLKLDVIAWMPLPEPYAPQTEDLKEAEE